MHQKTNKYNYFLHKTSVRAGIKLYLPYNLIHLFLNLLSVLPFPLLSKTSICAKEGFISTNDLSL